MSRRVLMKYVVYVKVPGQGDRVWGMYPDTEKGRWEAAVEMNRFNSLHGLKARMFRENVRRDDDGDSNHSD